MTHSDKNSWTRRDLLRISGGAGAGLVLAGCITTTNDNGGNGSSGGNGSGGGGGTSGGSSGGSTSGGSGGGDTATSGGGGGTPGNGSSGGSNSSNGSSSGGGGGGNNAFTIGMVDSRTGSLSAFGQRNKRGLKIALDAVNTTGINGRDLEVAVQDSQSESKAGVSAAQKLVNQNGVPFVIGAVGSGVSLAIYQSVIQNTDVVQLSQNSTSPSLSKYPGLLRMSPTGSKQSSVLANTIKKDGHDSVAVTWINNDYGQGINEAFKKAWDGDMAYNQSHDQGQSSYTNVVSGMANAGADAWLFITYQPEFSTMAQEAYSKGYKATFYGADSTKGPKVLKNTPKGSLDGMKIVVPSAAQDQKNYKQFASTFKKQYGTAPTAWSAYTYDCVVTAALSIATADGFTGKALKKTVRDVTRPKGKKVQTFSAAMDVLGNNGSASDINYEGVSGPIDFDKKGDPVPYLQVFTVKNHKYSSARFVSGQ